MTIPDGANDDRPPLFRSWRGWYGLTIGVLVALVALFRLLTVYFR